MSSNLSGQESAATQILQRLLGSQAFLNALPVGIYCCDSDGIIRHFNRRAAELWGRSPHIGDKDERFCGSSRLFWPDGRPLRHDETPMAEALSSGNGVRNTEVIIEHPDGNRIMAMVNIEPLFGEDGKFIGAVNCFQDISERHKAEVESAYLASIIASSDDAIISKTLDGVVTSWNESARRILGYEAEEMIGQSVTRIIPPELHDEEDEILGKLRRGEHIRDFETVRVSKAGDRINVSLTVSPVRDRSDRIVGVSTIARDITERKHAEELRILLISELNHRVKNTLAMVQAMAMQTVRHASDPAEFAASFSGRLRALALAHDLLTLNSWQGTDILPLLRDQLLLGGAEDERLTFSGPSVTLDAQIALHLSLAIYELGTNARKYGALSVPEGRLAIEWAVRSDDDHRLQLTWRESGGPKTSTPAKRGFGTTLIERSLQAHGGKASIDFRADGLICEIELPLPELARSGDGLPLTPQWSEPASSTLQARTPPDVRGKRILVVEDEPLIAMDLCDVLSEMGCAPVGPAATLGEARELIGTAEFDAALLDANLGGSPVDELVTALIRRGIPFAFVTGYGLEDLPDAFRHFRIANKPISRKATADLLAQLIREHGTRRRLRRKEADSA